MGLPLLLITSVLIYFFSRSNGRGQCATSYFILPWIACLAISFLPLVRYDREISILTCIYLAAALLAFAVGASLAPFLQARPSRLPSASTSFLFHPAHVAVVTAPTVLYTVLTFGLTFIGGASWLTSGALEGLAEARTAHWETFVDTEESLVTLLLSVCRSSAFLSVMLLSLYLSQRQLLFTLLSILSLLALLIDSLSVGGRANVTFAVLACVLFWLSGRGADGAQQGASLTAKTGFFGRLRSWHYLTAIVGGVATVWLLLVWFPMARNPDLSYNVDNYLHYLVGAELSQWVRKMMISSETRWLAVLAYSSSYFSSPIYTFGLFFEESDIARWHHMGVYNFGIVTRVLAIIFPIDASFLDIRKNIADIMFSVGRAENPWATGVRDIIVDFGLVGSIFALFLSGLAAQSVLIREERLGDPFIRCAGTLVRLGCLLFCFLSPLLLPIFFLAAVLVISMASLRELLPCARARSERSGTKLEQKVQLVPDRS